MSVDIDFKDDLSLGDKVKLSEKVSECLQEMRCPFNLYPHQIQGLNFENILPVTDWLCKELLKSWDVRAKMNK